MEPKPKRDHGSLWSRLGIGCLVLLGGSWFWSSEAGADFMDTERSKRCLERHDGMWTPRAHLRKSVCSNRIKLEAKVTSARPIPFHQEVPELAKGGCGESRVRSGPFSSGDCQAPRFSRMSSLMRILLCIVRWGSLAPCSQVG
jgi:hypothetical protein